MSERLLASSSGKVPWIIDEIHAIAGSKRGSHLALSLERLEALTGSSLTRIGLSATQKPIDEIARFLIGDRTRTTDGTLDCTIIDTGHVRERDIAIEIPRWRCRPRRWKA